MKRARLMIMIALVALLSCCGAAESWVVAQQKPSETIRLKPDASKAYLQIDAAENQLREQFKQLEDRRAYLLTGAGVEPGMQCTAGEDKIITCLKPLPSPSPSASPSP